MLALLQALLPGHLRGDGGRRPRQRLRAHHGAKKGLLGNVERVHGDGGDKYLVVGKGLSKI